MDALTGTAISISAVFGLGVTGLTAFMYYKKNQEKTEPMFTWSAEYLPYDDYYLISDISTDSDGELLRTTPKGYNHDDVFVKC